ncbi:MAG: lysophospholipid acyltransferase family protein [Blastomonas sp.]
MAEAAPDPAEAPPPPYPSTPDMAYLHWPMPTAIGYVRMAMRIAAMVLALFLCVPLYYIWRLLHLSNPWPRLFLKSVARACGAKVETVGVPLKRDVFIISNHLSWIDIPIIGGHNGTAFVSQDGIASWPVIGWLCTLNNTVFVSRTNRMGVASQINQLREALAETWAITIFPEGTTTDGSMLLPFKSPLLAVLDPPPPGIMVQPIFLDFGEQAKNLAWVGEETAPANALRLLTRRGTFRVRLHFLEPFDPDHLDGRKAIAAEARKRIEAELSASNPVSAPV